MNILEHNKSKCGLFSGVISWYNCSVQNNCQKLCSKCAHVHGHKRLDDDATKNVMSHLRFHGNMSLYIVASL